MRLFPQSRPSAGKKCPQSAGTAATSSTARIGRSAGEDHFDERGLGDDIDAGAILGLVGAGQDAGLGGDLAADFEHHGAGGLPTASIV